jgi:hypothetical protein
MAYPVPYCLPYTYVLDVDNANLLTYRLEQP